jgi:DNA-binding NtrC family response regulator
LVEHFIKMFNKKLNRHVEGVSQDVMDLFMTHAWPGNIRELKHALEHAFILCRGPVITLDQLPADIRGAGKARPRGPQKQTGGKQRLLQTLDETDWNVAKAARKLGISRRNIYRKISKYKIKRPDE